jgi:hypothetical protein
MFIVTSLAVMIYTEILICYESDNTVTIALCANKNTICRIVDACLGFIFQLITPLLLLEGLGMSTFF